MDEEETNGTREIQVSEVRVEEAVNNKESLHQDKAPPEVPEHVKALYERDKTLLTEEQDYRFRVFLNEYSN